MSFQAITNLSRFKDIVAVFVKHGFEDVVRALDLPGKSFTSGGGRPHEQPDSFQHLRLALEELGPAFIKFGQIMSLRSELLPAALIEELGKLQDQVPPEEFDGIREVIETSIGKPLNEAFVLLDEQPVAAASLSQVHRAVLRESRIPVALKVQRPGIRSKIETDLDIMDYAANLLHKRSPNLELYDLPGLVKSIRQTLLRELDFTREARHMQIARNLMKDLSGIHVPRVYAELTRERLLVMEYVQGSKIKETDRHNRPNAEALAKSGLKAVVKQILEHGFFHADPHPGNLLISDDGTLSLLDWGMIGRLTGQERRELLNLMTAIVEKDAQLMTEAIMVITYGRENLDRQELERSLLNLLDYHVTASLEELRLDRLIVDMLEIVREFQLRIPANHFITV